MKSLPELLKFQRKLSRAMHGRQMLSRNQGDFLPLLEFDFIKSAMQIFTKTDAHPCIVPKRLGAEEAVFIQLTNSVDDMLQCYMHFINFKNL